MLVENKKDLIVDILLISCLRKKNLFVILQERIEKTLEIQ